MAETPKTPKTKGPGKKIGGLKSWQWGLAGVATYGVYYLYKAHQANTAAAAANTAATGTTAGTGAADTSGTTGATYYIESPTGTTTTTTTSSTGSMTLTQFAAGIVSQLKLANAGNKGNLSQITTAVNQYLNNQPITNTTLANQISNIVGPGNALGNEALAQGGLIRPVHFAANVVTTAHTASEAVNRAATAVVSNAVTAQPTRAVTTPVATTTTRGTTKPKTSPAPGSSALDPLYKYTPGAGIVTDIPYGSSATPKKKGGVGFIPPVSPYGLNPIRDVGVQIRNTAVIGADVTKVAFQTAGKVVNSLLGGLGL